jgi:hypothetical protein
MRLTPKIKGSKYLSLLELALEGKYKPQTSERKHFNGPPFDMTQHEYLDYVEVGPIPLSGRLKSLVAVAFDLENEGDEGGGWLFHSIFQSLLFMEYEGKTTYPDYHITDDWNLFYVRKKTEDEKAYSRGRGHPVLAQ